MNWNRKSVIVTGGAGFIGSQLASRLHEMGAHVIIVDNLLTGDRNKAEAVCTVFVEGDVSQASTYDRLQGCDADYVFHFGSPSSVVLFNRKPEECIYQTIFGFRRIMKFAEERGVSKVVYPSSGSVYGDAPVPQAEDMMPEPTNLYGVCKLTCEQMAKLASDKVPSIGLRIFAGYGPGEETKGEIASVITLFAKAMMNDDRPSIYGSGEQKRDFIFIEDVLDATLKAADTNYTGVVNVGSGESHSFNEIVDIINKLLGKGVKPLYLNKSKKYLERTLANREKQDQILGLKPKALEAGINTLLNYLTVH
jgi:UDP-glucose 4-epimerase